MLRIEPLGKFKPLSSLLPDESPLCLYAHFEYNGAPMPISAVHKHWTKTRGEVQVRLVWLLPS